LRNPSQTPHPPPSIHHARRLPRRCASCVVRAGADPSDHDRTLHRLCASPRC
jgi:hypothetical protein